MFKIYMKILNIAKHNLYDVMRLRTRLGFQTEIVHFAVSKLQNLKNYTTVSISVVNCISIDSAVIFTKKLADAIQRCRYRRNVLFDLQYY